MPTALVPILFGAVFTLAAAYALGARLLWKLPAPPEVRLAMGAAALSFLVFLLLLADAGYWYIYLTVGTSAIAFWRWRPGVAYAEPVKSTLGAGRFAAVAIFGAYGLWYFVNALAPETLADGFTYHLGLPYEYTRLHGFPGRITFYDMVPQGMEMLYTMAVAFGRHSAAKLVEFACFAATVPLIFRICHRLQMSALAALTAATMYVCAPVVGATGASSYNDAAGVFFTLASFFVLLLWRETGDWRYLLPAGVLAGFCYAIKVPGILTVGTAVLFVLTRRRLKLAGVVLAGAAAAMAPWLLRNAVLTGNPFAPLLNSEFPNPYFHIATERALAANLGSFGGLTAWRVPWELAFGDGLSGTYGPLLFVLPLGLLALRWRAGRWCWAAAALLALPWFSDTGARFLMAAFVLAALTVAMVLPKPAAWAAIILQAVLCWPQIIGLRETRYAFRLHGFPLAAALRLESEDSYLRRHLDEYKLARMIEAHTPPQAKILAMLPVANAYLARDVRITWQSAEADRLFDTLNLSALPEEPLYDWQVSWPAQPLTRLRFRLPVSGKSEFDINEVQLYSAGDLIYTSPHWDLRAWPNSWESALALDGNLATRWRTWEPVLPGMYFEIRLDHLQKVSSAVLFSGTAPRSAPLEVYGLAPDGHWCFLPAQQKIQRSRQDLRADATLAIRLAGYRYLVTATGAGGSGPLGNAIAGHEAEWGLETVETAGPYYLYRVK